MRVGTLDQGVNMYTGKMNVEQHAAFSRVFADFPSQHHHPLSHPKPGDSQKNSHSHYHQQQQQQPVLCV